MWEPTRRLMNALGTMLVVAGRRMQGAPPRAGHAARGTAAAVPGCAARPAAGARQARSSLCTLPGRHLRYRH